MVAFYRARASLPPENAAAAAGASVSGRRAAKSPICLLLKTGPASGSRRSMTGPSNGETETGAPVVILELAEGCRVFVARSVGVEPDFTPETLPLVDHYLEVARGGIDQRPELL